MSGPTGTIQLTGLPGPGRPVWSGRTESAGEPVTCKNGLTAAR